MMDPTAEAVTRHLTQLAAAALHSARELSGAAAAIALLVVRTLEAGNKLLFCGNGGSAADAQHLATEYVVRFRRERRAFAALALTTDSSLLTAASNDLGFAYVFARQIEALGRAGDLLFLHTTSGESDNLVEAAAAARARGLVTVGMLARGGGRLRELVDHAVVIPTDDSAHAQELHLALGHAICDIVDARLGGDE
jgi:D-sedoheptulose 7-phosphate isomerase